MQPVNQQQFEASAAGHVPEPVRIADRLWSLAIPMPGGSLSYSLCIIHMDQSGSLTVVDPGSKSEAGMRALVNFLSSIGSSIDRVSRIVITHSHPDHLGLAGDLRELSGAPILMHRREQDHLDEQRVRGTAHRMHSMTRWGVPNETADLLVGLLPTSNATAAGVWQADVLLTDGEAIPVGDEPWEVLLTPGHTPGHVCIVDRRRKLLLTGDHVLPTVFPGIGMGIAVHESRPNLLTEYLESLSRLHEFDQFHVVPGHGYQFRGLAGRIHEIVDHLMYRAREVADAMSEDEAASNWTIASRLTWRSSWRKLSSTVFAYSALSQVDIYRDFIVRGDLQRFQS